MSRLSLLEGDAFASDVHRQKALHLLEYLVYGDADEAASSAGEGLASGWSECAESTLCLNKILCGIHPNDLVWGECEWLRAEKVIVDAFLCEVIKRFEALGEIAADEFREVFLQRHGLLSIEDNQWLLRIASEGRDVLIQGQINPYFGVQFPWMPVPLQIAWCDTYV